MAFKALSHLLIPSFLTDLISIFSLTPNQASVIFFLIQKVLGWSLL